MHIRPVRAKQFDMDALEQLQARFPPPPQGAAKEILLNCFDARGMSNAHSIPNDMPPTALRPGQAETRQRLQPRKPTFRSTGHRSTLPLSSSIFNTYMVFRKRAFRGFIYWCIAQHLVTTHARTCDPSSPCGRSRGNTSHVPSYYSTTRAAPEVGERRQSWHPGARPGVRYAWNTKEMLI